MSVCSNCGKENQVHYKYCLGCGAELTLDPEPGSAPAGGEARVVARTVLAETPDDDNMLSAIATALDKDPSLAPRTIDEDAVMTGPVPRTPATASGEIGGAPSGGEAEPAGATRECASCGNAVPVGFTFCGNCGARVDAPKAATAPGAYRASASTAPRGRLLLVRPDGTEGGSHPLEEGENPIGRGCGALFDADGYLSPRHAELVLNAAGLVVRDTGSLNGVFVKLTEEEELFDGDIFRIGQELLRFDEIRAPEPLEDGTEVLGSPNPGYWGRLAVIVGKDQDGSAFPLFGDAIVLGRERGDLVFPEDGYVSGTHARVALRDGRYWLCDMNSSNGTFLRIRGERLVPSGTFLLMGQQLFRVVYD